MANEDKGLPELGRELVDLTVAYAKQETIQPIKQLGGFVGKGLAGAALCSLGLVFLLLGVLRLVQAEGGAHLTGVWSFVPYLATIAVAGVAAFLGVRQIKGGKP